MSAGGNLKKVASERVNDLVMLIHLMNMYLCSVNNLEKTSRQDQDIRYKTNKDKLCMLTARVNIF